MIKVTEIPQAENHFRVFAGSFSQFHNINGLILKQEAINAGVSVEGVTVCSDGVVFVGESPFSSDDETELVARAGAHVGGAFDKLNHAAFAGEASASDDSPVTAVELQTGPMKKGDYLLIWYGEARVSAEDDHAVSCAMLTQSINGGEEAERAASCGVLSTGTNIGGMQIVQLKDGDKVNLKLKVARGARPSGTPSNSQAHLSRPQIFLRES